MKPSSIGFCSAGLANVLSISEIRPHSFAKATAFCKSTSRSVGIGRRLDVERFRARIHQLLDSCEIGFHVANDDAEARKIVTHQAVCAAIGLPRGNDFVACF